MGMTIEEFEEYAKTHNILFMTKEFYENRLKADLKAVLVELQLEIEGLDLENIDPEFQDGAECTREYIANMIEEKITSLKEEST